MRRWILTVVAAGFGMGQAMPDPHVISMPRPGGAASAGTMGIITASNGAVARRTRDGTFRLEASVNGEPLPMIFDTGASVVSLRAEDAQRAGIDVGSLHYVLTTQTANGTAKVAPVLIHTLQVGSIIEHDVRAVVGLPGALSSNLLGQTFLSRLGEYHVESDRIVLRAR